MKFLFGYIVILLFFLISCAFPETEQNSKDGAFKLYTHYKNICGIELPASSVNLYEDDGEILNEAIYRIDKKELAFFILKYHLKSSDTIFADTRPFFEEKRFGYVSNNFDFDFLKDSSLKPSGKNQYFCVETCKNKNYMRIIADTLRCLIWCKDLYRTYACAPEGTSYP